MNLTGINSFKFSGLVNQKVGVTVSSVISFSLLPLLFILLFRQLGCWGVSYERQEGCFAADSQEGQVDVQPSKMYTQMKLTNTNRKIYRSIRKFLGNQQYRPDLVEVSDVLCRPEA